MDIQLEQQVKKLWIMQQCRNQMARYEYLHTAKRHRETVGLFALSREDCWFENYDLGFFCGPDSIKRFFIDFHVKMDGSDTAGSFCRHDLTTEVIVVADDLKTAKACWMSPGCETRRDPVKDVLTAYWVWVRYAVDLIEEDGEWKFWHFTIFSDFCSDYYTSWVDMEYITPARPEMLAPDSAAAMELSYAKNRKPVFWPVPPEPYETYEYNTMTPRVWPES